MIPVEIRVSRTDRLCCPRCWRYHGIEDNHDHLCDRCCDVLIANHPDHESVPLIIAALERQRTKWRVNKENP